MRYLIGLLVALVFTGCATVGHIKPQRIELCTTYVLYAGFEDYEKAAPNRKMAEADGYYSRFKNEIHVIKWDLETIGHETMHALKQRGYPEPLIVDEGYEHWR